MMQTFILEFPNINESSKDVRLVRDIPNELRFMLSPNTYKEDNKPFVNFFWHVPKAAGSFVRNVCSDGYSLKPQADLGQPKKIDMFVRRMYGQSKTFSDISEAKNSVENL